MDEREARRFWDKVEVDGVCWEWAAGRNSAGYGYFRSSTGSRRAHRIAYEHLVGPIPSGLTLDHLCRNRSCVNPDHLEPVTHRENVLRGSGIAAQQARRHVCPRCGQQYDLTKTGYRRCRACSTAARVLALASGSIAHGTCSAYSAGCRCDDCRIAKRDRDRHDRAARKARLGSRTATLNVVELREST
jgi:DNA-directed RNA polymerase subunit RPC12/RpoP